ncbi:hypothetical protein B0H13DRAFT_1905389 [Mycena leptocephala]|nr:hypothetical protein B0H13DRAFT_1905389 [Mycena leptocephala]
MRFKSEPAELRASENVRLLEELIRSTQYSNTHLSTPTFSLSIANDASITGKEFQFGHSVRPTRARMPHTGIRSKCRNGRNKKPYVPRRDINSSHLCAQTLLPAGSPSPRSPPQERATGSLAHDRAQSTTREFKVKPVTPRPGGLPGLPQFRLANTKGLPILEIDPAALERWFHTGTYEDQDTGEGEGEGEGEDTRMDR